MELTTDQREELERIALSLYELDIPDLAEKGRAAIEARKSKRGRLRKLGAAWAALDGETQQDIVAHLRRMWDEYDHDKPLPDVGLVADGLIASMTRPANRTEDHPGLGQAVRHLWTIWATGKPEPVEVDRAALIALAAELAPLFGLGQDDAEKRTETILRAWDDGVVGDDAMPGRRSSKRWDKEGLRVE